MKKDAIISFDYEVFLGRKTGTIENCVLYPSQLILEILKRNNAKAIFFVDATWLLFLKEYFNAEFQSVSKQLKEIISIGSSVELHLHPQWLQAYTMHNEVNFKSFQNYRLHTLNKTEILDIFRKSIDLLESITYKKVRCFRAGGFCIEPFVQIKSAFELHEIKYDFSVAPGMRFIGDYENDVDFSKAPRLPFYKFQEDVQIPYDKGCFVEIPLSTYLNNSVYRLINKLLLMVKKDIIYGDGISIHEKSFFATSSVIRQLKFSYGILTIDRTNNSFFKYLLKMHFRNSDFLVILSHPKITSKEALTNLEYVTKNCNTLSSEDLDSFFDK